jgi:cytochrome c-type biogenesis protein CcmH
MRIAVAAIVAMPVAAFGLYLLLGSPEYPGQPLAGRAVSPDTQDIGSLIAAVETHLAASPDDGAGWAVIAPIYLRLGRNADAVEAFSNAIRILGSTAERESGLGESIVRLSGGAVTADARAAFERARALAPDDPMPRFFLALALQQDGRTDEALAAWRALLGDAPAGAEWAAIVREQIAALETPSAAAPGPSAEDVEAAADLVPEDRQAMIEGMVASLAARLAEEGSDAEGWARLVRSYMVLDRRADARDALARARLALVGDPAGLATVESAAQDAGVDMTEGEGR